MADEQDIIGSASEFIKGKINVKHGTGAYKYVASNKLLIRMTLAFIVGKSKFIHTDPVTQDSGLECKPTIQHQHMLKKCHKPSYIF